MGLHLNTLKANLPSMNAFTMPEQSPLQPAIRKRAHRANMDKEARNLQLLVLKDADDPELKPFIRAQLARAYRELGEFRLRLQGKGPPKAVDYSVKRKKPSARSGFADLPAEQQVAEQPKPANGV